MSKERKTSTKKRLLSGLMAFAMVFNSFPASAAELIMDQATESAFDDVPETVTVSDSGDIGVSDDLSAGQDVAEALSDDSSGTLVEEEDINDDADNTQIGRSLIQNRILHMLRTRNRRRTGLTIMEPSRPLYLKIRFAHCRLTTGSHICITWNQLRDWKNWI